MHDNCAQNLFSFILFLSDPIFTFYFSDLSFSVPVGIVILHIKNVACKYLSNRFFRGVLYQYIFYFFKRMFD